MFFCLSKGWEQGVIGMKKGGKRLIAIPSALAYGEKVKNTNGKTVSIWVATLETQRSRVLS